MIVVGLHHKSLCKGAGFDFVDFVIAGWAGMGWWLHVNILYDSILAGGLEFTVLSS